VNLPINDTFDIRFKDSLNLKARVPGQIPVDVQMQLALSKQGRLTAE